MLFTSGASEANNTVLRALDRDGAIVASTGEHPSVEAPLEDHAQHGRRVVRVPIDASGRVDKSLFVRSVGLAGWDA